MVAICTSGATLAADGIFNLRPRVAHIQTFSAIQSCQPLFQLDALLSIGSSLKLGTWSVQHCQSNTVVEQSSDGQVVLNRHREDHFVLFEANQLFDCAFLIIFLEVNFSIVKGGYSPPLNPPVFLFISHFHGNALKCTVEELVLA